MNIVDEEDRLDVQREEEENNLIELESPFFSLLNWMWLLHRNIPVF